MLEVRAVPLLLGLNKSGDTVVTVTVRVDKLIKKITGSDVGMNEIVTFICILVIFFCDIFSNRESSVVIGKRHRRVRKPVMSS